MARGAQGAAITLQRAQRWFMFMTEPLNGPNRKKVTLYQRSCPWVKPEKSTQIFHPIPPLILQGLKKVQNLTSFDPGHL